MRKRVFISGITGVMGMASLESLLGFKGEVDIVSIVRDSEKNRRIMEEYEDSIKIIWGILQDIVM